MRICHRSHEWICRDAKNFSSGFYCFMSMMFLLHLFGQKHPKSEAFDVIDDVCLPSSKMGKTERQKKSLEAKWALLSLSFSGSLISFERKKSFFLLSTFTCLINKHCSRATQKVNFLDCFKSEFQLISFHFSAELIERWKNEKRRTEVLTIGEFDLVPMERAEHAMESIYPKESHPSRDHMFGPGPNVEALMMRNSLDSVGRHEEEAKKGTESRSTWCLGEINKAAERIMWNGIE